MTKEIKFKSIVIMDLYNATIEVTITENVAFIYAFFSLPYVYQLGITSTEEEKKTVKNISRRFKK